MVKRDEVSLLESFQDDFFIQLILNRQNEDSNWLMILKEILQANQLLSNYQMILTVKKNEPKYCTISFNYSDLSDYNILRKYVGEYGYIVPVKGGKDIKVLKGERNLKCNLPTF